MNAVIEAIAAKALHQFRISATEYQTLNRLLNENTNLGDRDITLGRRVIYGVRHGIVHLDVEGGHWWLL
ncbi:MAG: hypothetical protein AAGG51_13590 [Cyanobacteria bacterium P01_G01_bin.54]